MKLIESTIILFLKHFGATYERKKFIDSINDLGIEIKHIYNENINTFFILDFTSNLKQFEYYPNLFLEIKWIFLRNKEIPECSNSTENFIHLNNYNINTFFQFSDSIFINKYKINYLKCLFGDIKPNIINSNIMSDDCIFEFEYSFSIQELNNFFGNNIDLNIITFNIKSYGYDITNINNYLFIKTNIKSRTLMLSEILRINHNYIFKENKKKIFFKDILEKFISKLFFNIDTTPFGKTGIKVDNPLGIYKNILTCKLENHINFVKDHPIYEYFSFGKDENDILFEITENISLQNNISYITSFLIWLINIFKKNIYIKNDIIFLNKKEFIKINFSNDIFHICLKRKIFYEELENINFLPTEDILIINKNNTLNSKLIDKFNLSLNIKNIDELFYKLSNIDFNFQILECFKKEDKSYNILLAKL